MYRKILLPLDGSERAEAILPHVENIAARFNARVVILIVEEPPVQLDIDEVVNAESYLAQRERMRKEIKAYAEKIARRFAGKGIAANFVIGTAPVNRCIADTAVEQNVDLVALASHGRGGSTRTYYGSVAAGVLQNIDRPILMIRSGNDDGNAPA